MRHPPVSDVMLASVFSIPRFELNAMLLEAELWPLFTRDDVRWYSDAVVYHLQLHRLFKGDIPAGLTWQDQFNKVEGALRD